MHFNFTLHKNRNHFLNGKKINIIILWFNDITQLMMRLNGVKYINNIELSIIYRINRDTMLLVEKNEIKCYSWKKEIQY